MFYNGQKFRVKVLDDTKKTCDSGITAVFQVTNISSRNDLHPRESENRYYGIGYDLIQMILIELLLNMIMDLQWLIQGRLSQLGMSPMFFQANVSRYFTQRFHINRVGHLLLDMNREEGQ